MSLVDGDEAFLDVAMRIDPEDKMCPGGDMGKHIMPRGITRGRGWNRSGRVSLREASPIR
jgi:hypothetical protein